MGAEVLTGHAASLGVAPLNLVVLVPVSPTRTTSRRGSAVSICTTNWLTSRSSYLRTTSNSFFWTAGASAKRRTANSSPARRNRRILLGRNHSSVLYGDLIILKRQVQPRIFVFIYISKEFALLFIMSVLLNCQFCFFFFFLI